MKLSKIAYAGSFDPPTKGHLWVIQEALALADEVVVFVAANSSKKHLFTEPERLRMMQKATAEFALSERVHVQTADGRYIAQQALSLGCSRLIRGVRNSTDFEHEAQLQRANSELLGIKTLFVMPPRELEAVSSSFAKSLIGPPGWHWILAPLLPTASLNALLKRRLQEHALRARLGELGPSLDWVLDEARWGGPLRKYHNTTHLCHVLDELYAHAPNASVELWQAAFAHDLIYTAQPGDEQKSSKAWKRARGLNVDPLVMSTEHKNPPPDEASSLLCSADLAILAAPQATYMQYAASVRAEWLALRSDITSEQFTQGRIAFLNKAKIRAQEGKLFTHPKYKESNAFAFLNLEHELSTLQLASTPQKAG